MKARTINTAPSRAESIFTDREEPRRAFWVVYDRVASDPGSVEAVSYYGVGGIGKTSLLFQLMREVKERAPRSPRAYYSFELSGRDKDDCLYFLAESLLQQRDGLQFPLFAAALLRLNQMAGRDIMDLEKRLENSVINSEEASVVVDVLSAVVPNFGIAKLAGRAGLKLFRVLKSSHDLRAGKYAAVYQEIESSSAAELMNNLHKYFCLDAVECMEQQSPPAVIMLDGYEVLSNTLERGDLAEVEDSWLWGRDGIIWSLPNIVWVIAGRNRLVWDQHDSEIRDSLEQHLLGNISEKDTAGFLRLSGVAEESLHHGLYELTEGTPVYLDMCINTYRQLKAARGAHYVPTVEDFGDNPTALAERFLRGMNSEHQRIVKLIACLPANWEEDLALTAARDAGFGAARGPFDDVCRLSLVEKDGNHSKLHSTLRTVVRRFMTDEERSRLDNVVLRILLARMKDKEYHAEREEYASWALEMLERGDNEPEFGEEQARTILDAADAYNDLGCYHTFCDYVQRVMAYAESHGCAEAVLNICRYRYSGVLLSLGRYKESMDPVRQACEFFLRDRGIEHSDTLNSLQIFSNCHYRLGNWQKALDLTRTIYDARLRLDGSESEKTISCLNNMAIFSVQMGEYKDAAELMEQAYASMLNLLGADHQRTVICLNNLAAVYSKLGEHEKATEIVGRVYDTQLRTLGEDHPEVLFSLFNLAVGYGTMGMHEKALGLAQKAYDEHVRLLGDKHPDTFSALNYLAECNFNLGNRGVARRLATQAFEERRKLLGVDHPDTMESFDLLGKIEQ